MWIGLVFTLALFILLPIGILLAIRQYARWGPVNQALACGRCRYPLAGVLAPRCPECGVDLSDAGAIPPGSRLPRKLPLALWIVQSLLIGYLAVIGCVMVISQIPAARERTINATRSVTFQDAALPPITTRHVARIAPFVPDTSTVELSMTDTPGAGTLWVDLRRRTWHIANGAHKPGIPTSDDLLAWWAARGPTPAESEAALRDHAQDIASELATLSQIGTQAIASRILSGAVLNIAAPHSVANTAVNTTNGPIRWILGPLAALACLIWMVALVRRLTGKREQYPPRAKTVAWTPPGAA